MKIKLDPSRFGEYVEVPPRTNELQLAAIEGMYKRYQVNPDSVTLLGDSDTILLTWPFGLRTTVSVEGETETL